MPRHQPTRHRRPVWAYLVTTLAASVATLVTALWSTASEAAQDIRAVATCVGTLR
jgi:hypothetical protein